MTRKIDHRRLGQLRQDQGEIANHIIDEFAAGRLSRRDFIRRGTVVGISVPLLGSILAACGSSGSSSAPSGGSSSAAGQAGAVIKAGIVTPTAAINPVTVADQGGLDMLGADRRVPVPVHPDADPEAGAGDQLVAEQPRPTSGRSRSARASSSTTAQPLTADDVVYTYQLHTNPKGGVERAVRFGGVLAPVRRGEGRRLHGGVPPQRPERELPVPDLLRQLQHDHPAEGLRPGQVGEHVHRHRPVQARLVHAEVRGHVHPQRVVLGQEGAALADPVHLLRHPEPVDPGADRRDDRRGRAVRGVRRARNCSPAATTSSS